MPCYDDQRLLVILKAYSQPVTAARLAHILGRSVAVAATLLDRLVHQQLLRQIHPHMFEMTESGRQAAIWPTGADDLDMLRDAIAALKVENQVLRAANRKWAEAAQPVEV